jgi:hypothetical protein
VARRGRQLDPGDPDADAPEWWRRSAALRRVPIIAAVVIIVILVRAMSSGRPAAITKSCTTPAFVLSSYNTASGHTVKWAATGPSGMHFALAIGVAGYAPAADGHLAPLPDPGVGQRDTRTTQPQTMGGGCTDHGLFGVMMPAGSYAVRMFRIVGGGANAAVTPVAQKTLKVTEH